MEDKISPEANTFSEKDQKKLLIDYVKAYGKLLKELYVTDYEDVPGRAAKEIHDPEKMKHLSDQIKLLDANPLTYLSFADLVAKVMATKIPDHSPRSPQQHAHIIYETIKEAQGTLPNTDGAVLVRIDQLFTLANFDPRIGYYTGNYGIGRKNEKGKADSAFSTPLEIDPAYRESYAKTILKAYQRLHQQEPFTPEHPFQIYIAGDGEGRISQETVRLLGESNTPPENVHLTMLDLSPTLLEKQKEASASPIPVTHLAHDARHIDKIFPRESFRGIMALEELIDVFPVHVINFDNESQEFVEPVFLLSPDGSYKKGYVPISHSPYAGAISAYLEAFPYIRDYLQMHKTAETAINLDLVRMIQRIAASPFTGYVIGGDYIKHYHALSHDRKAQYIKPSPINVIPLDKKEGENRTIDVAFSKICDISCDFDPGALAYAGYLGMQPQFAGRRGHFMQLADGKPIFTKKEVLRENQQNIDALTKRFNPPLSYLREIYNKQEELFDHYADPRINFVFAQGDMPPLFPQNPDAFTW